LPVLQGVLAKTGVKTWCFCGEFVVECVVNVVLLWSVFRLEKWDRDSGFIFEGFLFCEYGCAAQALPKLPSPRLTQHNADQLKANGPPTSI
jgi:hypothetical protein